jgi:hypothetical protein
MSKDLERCAFSRACVNPGPRYPLSGTNLRYCEQHIQLFEPLSLQLSGGQAQNDRRPAQRPGQTGAPHVRGFSETIERPFMANLNLGRRKG